MKEQQQLRRTAIQNMTAEETPFTLTRQQEIFKNTANATLKGRTFDAGHMDKFLQRSQYGEQSFMQSDPACVPEKMVYSGRVTNRTVNNGPGGGGGSNLLSHLGASQSSQIRPSYSFMGLNREEQKQQKYVEENHGPSPMQVLGNEPAFKDKDQEALIYYEKDLTNHLSRREHNMDKLSDAKKMLYDKTPATQNPGQLRYPKERRAEIKQIRENLDKFSDFKKNQIDLGKRERTIKGGWRHGVTGLENADSMCTSMYFKPTSEQLQKSNMAAKQKHDQRRDHLSVGFGTSSQMPVSSQDFKRTVSLLTNKPEQVVDVAAQWKHKHHVTENRLTQFNTFKRIGEPASNINRTQEDGCMKKVRIERSIKLDREDARGKGFNILGGHQQTDKTWKSTFGDQTKVIEPLVKPGIEITHNEKRQISTQFTEADKMNQTQRANIDCEPKKKITFVSSTRYTNRPTDNQLW